MPAQSLRSDPRIEGSPPVHYICMFTLLFAFWVILVGNLEPKFTIYGIITCVVTVYLTYPLLLIPNRDKTRLYFIFDVNPVRFLSYFGWLMYQLVMANVDVLLATTDQELAIDPKILRFRFTLDNPIGEVLLANSITLTPGTVTLNLTPDGLYEIHALTKGAADGILSGDFPAHIARLYGEPCNFQMVEEAADA